MERPMNVLALVKGDERFVFLYDDASLEQLISTLGRYAADPEMNFSWYDAAVMSDRVRQQVRQSRPTSSKNRLTEIRH